MEPKYYTNERSQQIVLSVLKANGIKKVIASPGTTNVTLVGSMQNDPWFEMYSSVDERSAAYMACGLAAESGEPVVITCTGATASRNYLPGLTEAYYRKLPILAITANQGSQNVGHLIPQNIDRAAVLNDIVRISVQIGVTKDNEDEWKNNVLANKAILELFRHGGGPVHINLSTTYSRDFTVKELPYCRIIKRYMPFDALPPIPSGNIGIFVGSHKQFSTEDTNVIDKFCATYDAVVIQDHTGGYHGKYAVNYCIEGAQQLKHSTLGKFDTVIHIGEVSGDYYGNTIVTKNIWRVSEDGEIKDTFRKLSCVFEMPENVFFKIYSKDNITNHNQFDQYEIHYNKNISNLGELPFSNAWIARKISLEIPQNSILHLGILNSLRSWNWFKLPNNVRSYSNVGGFGIDGGISTMVGASFSNPNSLYFLVIGDLAFFYDMNVLGNRHVGNNVRILLVNNGRGSEFRLYTHACYQWGKRADEFMAAAGHYGNQHPELVKNYAENLGYKYMSASNKEQFEYTYKEFLNPEIGTQPIVFEVFTNEKDESAALMMIQQLEKPTGSEHVIEKAKDAIRKVVPSPVMDLLKGILK